MITFAPYHPDHKSSLISILRLNTPDFFDASEESDFISYLDHDIEDYFVALFNNDIIGGGGTYYKLNTKEAGLAWGMIHPNYQGKGIGKALVKHRLNHIQKNTSINTIRTQTSQFTYKFYEKMGFKIHKIEKDFWAKNYDLYDMIKKNS